MEQRISIVTFGVADLKRSAEFYERMGWRRAVSKAEGIIFFQAGGMALALYPRHELAKDANVAPEGEGFNGISLAYNARNREEVDAVLREAGGAGARILKRGARGFLGRIFGILCRSRRISVGGRLESVLPDRRGWKYSNS